MTRKKRNVKVLENATVRLCNFGTVPEEIKGHAKRREFHAILIGGYNDKKKTWYICLEKLECRQRSMMWCCLK